MTNEGLSVILFLIHLEIFAYVVYYSIVAHIKNVYTSAYDDKFAISFGIYGMLGIMMSLLMYYGVKPDVQMTLIVCMSLCIFICGITLGLKMHSKLKRAQNPLEEHDYSKPHRPHEDSTGKLQGHHN